MQTEPPVDPSSLSRWRKRLGEVGMEELLAQSIEAAKRAKVIKPSSVQRVIVDTTVMEKAIAYPTDSALLERSREHLVKAVRQCSLHLRQNYNREAPRLAQQVGRYAHAKLFRRMHASLRTCARGWDAFIVISRVSWSRCLRHSASCSMTCWPGPAVS